MNTENRKPAAWTAATLLVALLALAAIGCGGSDSTADPGASAPGYSKAIAKAPPSASAASMAAITRSASVPLARVNASAARWTT